MRRTTLAMVGAALLCGVAAAQNADTSRIHPITTPIRDAGTLDLATGTWSLSTGADYVGKIFDNTCQWTGGGFYFGPEHCEDIYDDGRIPSPTDPAAPPGAEVDNVIDGFQIAYCTAFPTGSVDIKISFYEQMAPCAGWISQTAIVPPNYNGAVAFVDLAGLNLPGDNTGGGSLACWIVSITLGNGFCMLSDGDGSWNNQDDEFGWAFQHEMDNATYGVANGPIISAEPLVAPFGACSYGIVCGTDATGNPCGTGRNVADQMWENVDGCAQGTTIPCTGVPPGSCPNAAGAGTTCYWFGGWPANPWASFWMEITSSGPCTGGCTPVFYCTPKTSSSGCVPTMTTSSAGCPSTGANDYQVIATQTEAGKPGIIFYGYAPAAIPFQCSFLCVQPPIKRTPPQSTGGTTTCTGTLTWTVNNPGDPPGTQVFYQGWFRDPMDPCGFGTGLSDAVELTFQP